MARSAPGRHYRKSVLLAEITAWYPDDASAERWFAETCWPDGVRHHVTPPTDVGGDGRFASDRLALSRPVGSSRAYEPARLEGWITDRRRLMTGRFESRLVRRTFPVQGEPNR